MGCRRFACHLVAQYGIDTHGHVDHSKPAETIASIPNDGDGHFYNQCIW